jgi:hypothetical protein
MSNDDTPQSQPIRDDQVPNNAGMKSVVFIYKIISLFFQEDLVGL